jgi:hypothetical protein
MEGAWSGTTAGRGTSTSARVTLLVAAWCAACDGRETPVPTICRDGDPVARLRLVNKSQRTLYLDDVGFLTRHEGKWVPFALDDPTWCRVLCEPCEATCGGCEAPSYFPCPPGLLALAPGESSDVVWDGTMLLVGLDSKCTCEGDVVSCVEKTRASSGRYRVVYCGSAEYTPITDYPCLTGPGPLPGVLVDRQCNEVELAYDETLCADGTVEIPLQ